MIRRRIVSWSSFLHLLPLSGAHGRTGQPAGSYTNTAIDVLSVLNEAKRGIKTLAVREYKPMGQPIELRFYQRYTNNPLHASGIQFLTHYDHHQRWRVHGGDYIDYLHWGKEQGQARLPHRHQRVAFDFDDSLPPTKAAYKEELFASQDPSSHLHGHGSMDPTFNPERKVFSSTEHWNRLFSKRRPGQGDIDVSGFGTRSLLGSLATHTDVDSEAAFHVENRAPNHGSVPGINQPYLGDQDTKMMQSMSVPLNKAQTVTSNEGRFSKSIYLNNPAKHQCVSANLAKSLQREIDRATNAVYSKLTTLSAAQSGLTDYFCQGVDFTEVAHYTGMASICQSQAQGLEEEKLQAIQSNASEAKVASLDHRISEVLSRAARFESRADAILRQHAALLWRIFVAARPLMTVINGKCRGTGCGVGLMAKYAVTRDASEFIFDGPNRALTPYGGLTHFLARPETSLKFPGLAEFTMLTGSSLFAGDVLRLGWTDLFATVPDLEYHVKEWFNDSEHMHNDAVVWQLGHLLESTCKMREAHSGAVERSAVTPMRATWIEDAFADQSSVEGIMRTLGEMERLPATDPHNTRDVATRTPFSLPSVEHGISKLRTSNLHFSLEPWDISAPTESIESRLMAEVFTSYVLERRGTVDVVLNTDRHKLRRWRDQRYKEYQAFQALQRAPQARHVYVRLEGCEGKLVEFEFVFDKNNANDEMRAIQTISDHQGSKTTPRSEGRTALLNDDADVERISMLEALKAEVRSRLQFPADRPLSIGWYLPTLDTAEVLNDQELLEILRYDPGVEDPRSPATNFPPIYFVVKRQEMLMSEWAYAVKHQLLLQSPFALKASFALLQDVRRDGSHEKVASLSESLSKEFRFIRRMICREEFHRVGQYTERDMAFWADIRDRRSKNIHETEAPLRPMKSFDEVFEGNVTIDGHVFQVRPRWSPRTLEEVADVDVGKLAAPLDYGSDRTTDLDVPTFTSKQDFVQGMVDDAGVEVVPGLGEVDTKTGAKRVTPLESNAHVPENVNFYEMARHPWNDKATSWRQDGFTAGSQEYFQQQYEAAQKELYDAKGTGQYNYWPSTSDAEKKSSWVEEESSLLQDRFYSAFRDGERQVEAWATELRRQATTGNLSKRLEIATPQEKIMDDEYYRWFIQPGSHPNPSGLIRGGPQQKVVASGEDGGESQEDLDVRRVLASLGDSGASQEVASDLDMAQFDDSVEAPVAAEELVISPDEV